MRQARLSGRTAANSLLNHSDHSNGIVFSNCFSASLKFRITNGRVAEDLQPIPQDGCLTQTSRLLALSLLAEKLPDTLELHHYDCFVARTPRPRGPEIEVN